MIEILEQALGVEAVRNLMPMQPGDVKVTAADVGLLERDFGIRPEIGLEEGVHRFVEWFRAYFNA